MKYSTLPLNNNRLFYSVKRFESIAYNVRLKRNLFIYAKYFQWFTRCLSWFTSLLQSNKIASANTLQTNQYRKRLIIFFITKQQYSFLDVLARIMLSSSSLVCFSLKWNPLLFFFSYKRIQDQVSGFFPIFFIDSCLLKDSSFKQNFVSTFIKHPMFYIWNFKVYHTPFFFKKAYPLFVPAGYGLYLLLFWWRFIFR